MKNNLEILQIEKWDESFSNDIQENALAALEAGKVVYLPHLPFELNEEEKQFLSPSIVSPKSKNISYVLSSDKLGGTLCEGTQREFLKAMIKRYAVRSRLFLELLFPLYLPHLQQGRTSFRPIEAAGRNISRLKDDTLLHVDAFPATPVKGKRILRVFTNVNPFGKPRVWRIGESFTNVVSTFGPSLKSPFPGLAFLMKLLKMTKDNRTLYDHYMLGLHDAMKMDEAYQENVSKEEVQLAAGATWIVYTDQVSHAALSGQYLFEQTFYLSPDIMKDKDSVPLHVLEKFYKKNLI